MKKMLPALQNRWSVSSSPLYRHIKEKEGSEGLQEQWLNMVLTALQTDEELVFLRGDPAFKELLAPFGAGKNVPKDRNILSPRRIQK